MPFGWKTHRLVHMTSLLFIELDNIYQANNKQYTAYFVSFIYLHGRAACMFCTVACSRASARAFPTTVARLRTDTPILYVFFPGAKYSGPRWLLYKESKSYVVFCMLYREMQMQCDVVWCGAMQSSAIAPEVC